MQPNEWSDGFDCVIVGGGPAGASAAVNLARMRRRVLLVDERDRFLWVHVARNLVGFPDGIDAAELRRLGWRHAARYGASLAAGHVSGATRDGDTFRVRIERLPDEGPPYAAASGIPRDAEAARLFTDVPQGGVTVAARTVILATGVFGHFPEFPGRDACVGTSLFWCIHCSGYESIDRIVAVVGHDAEAVDTALDLLAFTSRVTLVAGRTGGFDVDASRLADVAAAGIATYPCAVARYENASGRMQALVLDDPGSTRIPVEHVYTIRPTVAATDLARQLGVELNAAGQIVATTDQLTNVPGVYAAGDATCLNDHQVSAAVHEGGKAAFGAGWYLSRHG